MPSRPPSLRPKAKRVAWKREGKGRTTTERGYGWKHQQDRKALLAEEPLCRACSKVGRITAAAIADHITPLAEGGARDRTNLQPLCRPCSDAKTAAEATRARGR